MKPDIIHIKNEKFVLLPYVVYKDLIEAIEMKEDVKAFDDAKSQNDETFPYEPIERILSGENPVKVYREYRQLSQTALAKKAGVSRQFISQIEHGQRKGTAEVLKQISAALNIRLDDIV